MAEEYLSSFTGEQIDGAVGKQHTHANKEILDQIAQLPLDDGEYLPWVYGVFQDRSFKAGVHEILTPLEVISGDNSIIEGNRFYAPSAGIYLAYQGGGTISSGTALYPYIYKNTESQEYQHRIATNGLSSGEAIPIVNTAVYLDVGDYLVFSINMTASRSSMNANNTQRYFYFGKIG